MQGGALQRKAHYEQDQNDNTAGRNGRRRDDENYLADDKGRADLSLRRAEHRILRSGAS